MPKFVAREKRLFQRIDIDAKVSIAIKPAIDSNETVAAIAIALISFHVKAPITYGYHFLALSALSTPVHDLRPICLP
jgi:hypothetical protein